MELNPDWESVSVTDGGPRDAVEPTDVQLEAVEIRLPHVDLPKLAATGMLPYDPETAMVELADESLRQELAN